MPAAISDDKKAQAIVDAVYFGDTEAAKRHSISTKSIQRWRQEISDNPALSGIVQEKLQKRDESWASEIPAALNAGIVWLKDAFAQARKSDPEAIRAVTEAMATLAEIAMTREVIDARFTGQDRAEGKKAQ